MASWAKSGRGGALSPQQSPPSPSAGVPSPSETMNRSSSISIGNNSGKHVDDQQQPTSVTNKEGKTTRPGSSGARSGGSTSPNIEKRTSDRRTAQPGPFGRTSNGDEDRHYASHFQEQQTIEHQESRHLDATSPQHQLSDYRQRLAREMSARVNNQTSPVTSPFAKRPSPIEEEKVSASGSPSAPSAPSASPTKPTALPSALASTPASALLSSSSSGTTTSTDSARTVRAADPGKGVTARTPSYPFPRMAMPSASRDPSFVSTAAWSAHARSSQARLQSDRDRGSSGAGFESEQKSTQSRSEPQRQESAYSFRSDQVLSSPSTPASAVTFLPSSALGRDPHGEAGKYATLNGSHYLDLHDFETPNLYELALALSTEPGLDAWWDAIVQIATQWYKAERVALVIPSDSTDVENMPWGQKATFKIREKDDELSLGYMGHDSLVAATTDLGSDATPLLSTSGILSPPPPAPSPAPAEQLRRPNLTARYSYTTYEERKENNQLDDPKPGAGAGQTSAAPIRPSLSRCQTSQPVATQRTDIPKADWPAEMLPPKPYTALKHSVLEEHDATEDPHDTTTYVTGSSLQQQSETRGRVLPVLQALDYEADPLIDHNGVQRVLDRGHVVALTRSYPYITPKQPETPAPAPITTQNQQPPTPDGGDEETMANTNLSKLANELASGSNQRLQQGSPLKLSALLGTSGLPPTKNSNARPSASYMRRLTGASIASKLEEAKPQRSKSPLYEEYEQMPPSPWSQSPAPSPAVRHDPNENPFFSDTVVDEDSFNPALSPEDYKEARPLEAIGFDNACTVLHIPLYHPLLSKTAQPFRLDKSKMERRSSPRRDNDRSSDHSVETSPSRRKEMPIAILSILTPIIPYPSKLRYSLEHLAPHMATSFSLCVHYSNLEAEINGLNRRRHEMSGFGAVDTEGHPLPTASAFMNTPYLPSEDHISHRSQTGSMTSFSDYSARSRSIAGSPGGTPGWDSAALNVFLERRANTGTGISPSIASLTGDGYFGMRTSNMGAFGRPATTPGGTSSNGGGGGGGPSARERGRKNSVSHSEKRLSALRLPEVTLSAQEERVGSPLPDLSTTANLPAALSSPSINRNEDSPASSQQISRGSGTMSAETGVGSSTEALSSSANSRTAHPAPALIGDPVPPLPPSDSKKRPVERDAVVSEELKLAFSDRAPPVSPAVHTPGGTPHQRHPRFQHQHSHSHGGHSQLHSYGADFASTFPSLPPVGPLRPVDMPPPSDRLKGLILDSLPAHVFVAMPQTGAIVWVNSRYLAYRGQTVEGLAEDPWGSLHPDDCDEYLKAWSHSVRTGDQFSRTVRIRRFDGSYRWFQARAVASRDRRNSIMQFLGSYMDIHDQHIAELKAARQEEIEASETKHRILANLIPQIIFTANEEEGVTFANEQWLSYTGQSFQDLLGLGFLDNVHPDDLAKCSFLPVPAHLQERRKRLLQSVSSPLSARGANNVGDRDRKTESGNDEELSELAELARRGIILVTTDDNGRPSYTTEVRLRSKTGEYRWHLVRCVETGTVDFGKGYNSYFGSATDINDHKLLETKLKEAMDSKTRFLSNMSHEIRTPLIGISGMVSFLQDTVLDEEQRDYTNTIQTSANSLLMIINDILDLSKVDAGMMKLSFEWFHTQSLIEDVNELVSTMAIAKRLELNYIVDDDVPSWVKGDRVRIRQVLLNVIGNAIKFTTKGEVFSRCRIVKNKSNAGANQIELEFSVTDTGRGFTKEEADLIFKPFSQIDGSSTRQHGGSGLGLVISRQLVELHGGTMNGSAVPGKGSTFTFTAIFNLPTEQDHPDGHLTPSAEANPKAPNLTLTAMGLATPSFMDPAAIIAAAAASAAGAGSTGVSSAPVDVEPNATATATASPAGGSSGSSDPSIASNKSHPLSERSSSISSVNTNTGGLTHFSEAARASGQDVSHMKFRVPPSGSDVPSPRLPALPVPRSSDTTTTATEATGAFASRTGAAETKPAVPKRTLSQPSSFSILIICPQTHSREATAQHIETTLPKDRPHSITAVATMSEAQDLIKTEAKPFTHVVVNLPSAQEVLELVDQLDRSTMLETAHVLVLSDSVQRQEVNKLAAGTRYEQRLSEARVMYIYKPVKPSRFAVIFDPKHESDISIDRNRSNAQRLVETQKKSYLDLSQRMGNKGYKVLLVEDNMVNQKVLTKYLRKVGVDVDMAADGVECTDTVFARPHDYYSLILCDLHMPRKDGYQACREIRGWEAKGNYKKKIPIIALSANVMSDVYDKCIEAGFSKYITKPVDFVVLSRALAEFF
ncbi:hypothetical protein SPBR_03883 [Sporothrix brasiliensis 5110]|uniref:histidine kinase n=1 Tax=Sporothrix brasiliensis 5110 TaxID=1398154 RepID=A0A0C2J1N8_9PEZI|nr:uncharacterized protein SPBR_03883 [Sporothrix brasiliensis 5110]KIH95226.1 hypothetical protein SPBR_03883 [Sporothrix brasiliensis 5110]